MTDNVKSSLIVGQNKKKDPKQSGSGKDIEYKQVSPSNDFPGELSDEEKEAEFNRQHEQYIKMKMERKQELFRRKREEFGSSSSESSQGSSEEEISEPMKIHKKVNPKASKGRLDKKPPELLSHYPILLQLKKSSVEAQLVLHLQNFEVNKRTILFSRINKVSISKVDNKGKLMHKLRIGVGSDQDIVLSPSEKQEPSFSMIDLFLKLVRIRIELSQIKMPQQSPRCSPEEFGPLREGALIFDKILKKSQFFGAWEDRYVIIRPSGLESYPSLKAKPTMQIFLKQITELQTQFELFKQKLVVKLFYNGTKTDFGLPFDPTLSWVTKFAQLLTIS